MITKKLIDYSKISHILAGVNTENKFSVWWYDLKKSIRYMIPYQIVDFYNKKIETIWSPRHSRIRKVIPKHWMDLDYVLVEVNFEIIKSFYEDEYRGGLVDWTVDKNHSEFANWLERSYRYIKYIRPELELEKEAAYPSNDISIKQREKMSYNELYGEVDKIEKHIHRMDTKVLTDLIKYRDFLWT